MAMHYDLITNYTVYFKTCEYTIEHNMIFIIICICNAYYHNSWYMR